MPTSQGAVSFESASNCVRRFRGVGVSGVAMDRLRAWGKGIAQLAIACAVALFALAPSLDAAFCPESKPAPTTSSAATFQQVAMATNAERGRPSPALVGFCLYGHCQHSVAFPPPMAADHAPASDRPTERHALANTALPVSNPEFELNRPPRA